jgi:hypothetical protein
LFKHARQCSHHGFTTPQLFYPDRPNAPVLHRQISKTLCTSVSLLSSGFEFLCTSGYSSSSSKSWSSWPSE